MPLSLRVHVLEARNLAPKDRNGSSDPFVILEFGSQKGKTRVIKKSLNPVWDEQVNFDLPPVPPLSLKATVWDHDLVPPNDFLGFINISLESILNGDISSDQLNSAEWIPLLKRSTDSTVSGDVRLKVAIVGDPTEITAFKKSILQTDFLVQRESSPGSTPDSLEKITLDGDYTAEYNPAEVSITRFQSDDKLIDLEGVLTLNVLGANDLPPDPNECIPVLFDCDPFCVVTLGDRSARTKIKMHTINPEWNELVILPITKFAAKQWSVRFSVYDWDRISANDHIGHVDIPVSQLITNNNTEISVPLILSTEHTSLEDKNKQHAKIRARATFRPVSEVRSSLWRKLVVASANNDDPQSSPDNGAKLSNGLKISAYSIITIFESLGLDIDEAELNAAYTAVNQRQGSDLSIDDAVELCDILFMNNVQNDACFKIAECPICQVPFSSMTDKIPHLEVCVGSVRDTSDGGFMMGGFVTEEQSSRKGLTKLVHKFTHGEYSVGADSANIIVMNRKNGQLIEEKIATFVRLGIRMLYQVSVKPVNTARIKAVLEKMSYKQGVKYSNPKSKNEIRKFIKFHNLNTNEVLDPIDSFNNFNEFFYRKLKPGARPLASADPGIAVSVADCRLMAFPTIEIAQELWIKGQQFTVPSLLGDSLKEDEKNRYDGGSLIIFRLAPQDYHRYHIPVDGKLSETTLIQGTYYTVNPMAIRASEVNVYTENKRAITYIDSQEFGRVAYVAVGAMLVGSINQTSTPGQLVKRGDEHGYFAFGGSTIILIFEPNRIILDSDLVLNSSKKLETLVAVGMSVGRVCSSGKDL